MTGETLTPPAGSPMGDGALGMVGDRVRAVRFAIGSSGFDDNKTVPPGTEGVITYIDGTGSRFVRWSNGSSISLLLDQDEWEVIS